MCTWLLRFMSCYFHARRLLVEPSPSFPVSDGTFFKVTEDKNFKVTEETKKALGYFEILEPAPGVNSCKKYIAFPPNPKLLFLPQSPSIGLLLFT